MKKILISFGDKNYKKSLDLLEKTSLENGVDNFLGYTKSWLISTNFYKKSKRNQYILNKSRGAGYWMWKPFIILETFKSLGDNDIVLYSDAGLKVIDNLNPLYKVAQNDSNDGKVLFKLPTVGVPHHLAKTWTKRDCFVLMDCDSEKYWGANMTNGAISLWKKTSGNIKFLEEWQEYLRDPKIITDDGNIMGKSNFMEFRDHRHDQSVLTLLSVKYNFELFRDPTQYGNSEISKFNNSPYSQLFHHHRNFKH